MLKRVVEGLGIARINFLLEGNILRQNMLSINKTLRRLDIFNNLIYGVKLRS